MMDNDIIKALEWHLNRETHCNKCPYKEFKNRNDENCVGRMLKDALDLINRKDAEIERLESEYPCKVKCGNNCEIWAKTLKDYDNLIGDISAEGIKEFWEKVRKHTKLFSMFLSQAEESEFISYGDNLVKEMTEGCENG